MTGERAPVRSVALPAEHGGWSLTLEPAILGLAVAPSWAGLCLTLAALLAFLARTPLKLALVDRRRERRLDRTGLAERVAAAYLAGLAVAVAGAGLTAQGSFWPPLAAAAPLVAVQLVYDVRSRSRRLVPELAGTVGIASVATAIAMAGGLTGREAWGLWVVAAARALAAVLFVRVQLRRAKGQPFRVRESDAAQAAAVAMGAAGLGWEAVPVAGLAALVALAAVHVALVRMPPPRAPVLGAQQVALGLGVVLATALGVRAP